MANGDKQQVQEKHPTAKAVLINGCYVIYAGDPPVQLSYQSETHPSAAMAWKIAAVLLRNGITP